MDDEMDEHMALRQKDEIRNDVHRFRFLLLAHSICVRALESILNTQVLGAASNFPMCRGPFTTYRATRRLQVWHTLYCCKKVGQGRGAMSQDFELEIRV